MRAAPRESRSVALCMDAKWSANTCKWYQTYISNRVSGRAGRVGVGSGRGYTNTDVPNLSSSRVNVLRQSTVIPIANAADGARCATTPLLRLSVERVGVMCSLRGPRLRVPSRPSTPGRLPYSAGASLCRLHERLQRRLDAVGGTGRGGDRPELLVVRRVPRVWRRELHARAGGVSGVCVQGRVESVACKTCTQSAEGSSGEMVEYHDE